MPPPIRRLCCGRGGSVVVDACEKSEWMYVHTTSQNSATHRPIKVKSPVEARAHASRITQAHTTPHVTDHHQLRVPCLDQVDRSPLLSIESIEWSQISSQAWLASHWLGWGCARADPRGRGRIWPGPFSDIDPTRVETEST